MVTLSTALLQEIKNSYLKKSCGTTRKSHLNQEILPVQVALVQSKKAGLYLPALAVGSADKLVGLLQVGDPDIIAIPE